MSFVLNHERCLQQPKSHWKRIQSKHRSAVVSVHFGLRGPGNIVWSFAGVVWPTRNCTTGRRGWYYLSWCTYFILHTKHWTSIVKEVFDQKYHVKDYLLFWPTLNYIRRLICFFPVAKVSLVKDWKTVDLQELEINLFETVCDNSILERFIRNEWTHPNAGQDRLLRS